MKEELEEANEMVIDKEEGEEAKANAKTGEGEAREGDGAADGRAKARVGLDDGAERFDVLADEAPAYIIVSDQEGGSSVELPLELDHALLVKTLQIEYAGAMGIKYRSVAHFPSFLFFCFIRCLFVVLWRYVAF